MTTDTTSVHIVTREELRDLFGCKEGDTLSIEYFGGPDNSYLKATVKRTRKDRPMVSLRN